MKFIRPLLFALVLLGGASIAQDIRATTDDGRSVVLRKTGVWFFTDRSACEDGRAVIYDGRAVRLDRSGKWVFLNNKDPLPVPVPKFVRNAHAASASADASPGYSGESSHPFLSQYAVEIGRSDGSAAEQQEFTSKQYVLVYFSAHWCSPCRAFTPLLVQYYNQRGGGQKFEVVFVSDDYTAQDMVGYMREMQMPWVGVRWRSDGARAIARRYCGPGIPCLVLLNANDEVLSDSYVNQKYVGPRKVLADLDRILSQ